MCVCVHVYFSVCVCMCILVCVLVCVMQVYACVFKSCGTMKIFFY